jgi:hypothetical protein
VRAVSMLRFDLSGGAAILRSRKAAGGARE